MLLLKNCKLIPFLTEGTELTEADVLVDGSKICEILPAGTGKDGDCEQVIDLQGKTLLPGLIDMHTHLTMVDMNESFGRWGPVSPSKFTINAIRYAQLYLQCGFTTVRDCGDMTSYPTKYVRDAMNKGKLEGPRLRACGPIVESHWEGSDAMPGFDRMNFPVDGPIGFRRAARTLLGDGFDFVKLYGSGSLLMASNEPGYPIIESEEIEEAVRVADLTGTYVAIHAHGATAIDMAARAGCHTIEHASMISDETIKYLKEERPDNGLVLTLYACDEIMWDPTTYNGARMTKLFPTIKKSLQSAYEAGLTMGWGTDVQMKTFQNEPMREFKIRKETLEFENEEILKQATISSAKLMGLDDIIGTVKAGKEADLVVVDGDPVADISVMYQPPLHVIKGGAVVR